MLEDEQEDIIGKALRAQRLNPTDIGLKYSDALHALTTDQLHQAAKVLNLKASALVKLGEPFATLSLPKEVEMITSSFGHLGVNAFYVTMEDYRFLIDTGTELNKVSHLSPDTILITHNHPDHTACLNHFSTTVIHPKPTVDLSAFNIQTFDVSGHSTPSLAYYFPQLSIPCCFVGDAIFKRSIGGCSNKKNYAAALTNVTTMLRSLPPETILCVGHGPNTTVANELEENPFFL